MGRRTPPLAQTGLESVKKSLQVALSWHGLSSAPPALINTDPLGTNRVRLSQTRIDDDPRNKAPGNAYRGAVRRRGARPDQHVLVPQSGCAARGGRVADPGRDRARPGGLGRDRRLGVS